VFTLEALPARQGDALLLHYGTAQKPKLIVIDSGPPPVYGAAMRPALERLKEARGGSLSIRMLMVSHLDDDHVGGVVNLTGELCDQLDSGEPESWKIETFWNNTFEDLVKNQPNLGAAEASAIASSISDVLPPASLDRAGAVMASVGQGRRVRDNARRLGDVNKPFAGLVMSQKKPIPMGDGLSFVVVGPSKAHLLDLQKEWNKKVKALKSANKKVAGQAAAYLDESVYNLSSIVVLAQNAGKTMLLTGDARGDYILESLEEVGLLKKGKSMKVDVLKMPHHGSDRNVDADFFERIVADHYVFSGDGRHDNPEPETIALLVKARGKDRYTMHFTYALSEFVSDFPKAKAAKLKKLLVPGPGQKFQVVTAAPGQSIRVAL
jgi:hypothetical protein